ncbi:MAG: SRPBCC family protein [Acidimicrobiales bacterium]
MTDDFTPAVHEGRKVWASRVIAAPAETIFDLLTDPARHSEIDGSGTVQKSAVSGPPRLEMGSRFGMKMRMGPFPYGIKSTVLEYEPNRLIAWGHLGKHRWRYELEPVDDDHTKVTETFDYSTAAIPSALELMGYPKRHATNIEKTLERLDAAVTT